MGITSVGERRVRRVELFRKIAQRAEDARSQDEEAAKAARKQAGSSGKGGKD
jgi:hypothetical protein